MASKTISIKKEIYERLSKQKKTKESFSDLIKRLLDTLDRKRNNKDEVLKEIYGSPEEIISKDFMKSVKKIHDEINQNFHIDIKDPSRKKKHN